MGHTHTKIVVVHQTAGLRRKIKRKQEEIKILQEKQKMKEPIELYERQNELQERFIN